MRSALARTGRLTPLAAACLMVFVLAPSPARAQEADRFNLSAFGSWELERFNSLGADSLGFTYERSPENGVMIDFRVIDLPLGKTGPKPALHLTGGVATSTRILGPTFEGQLVGEFQVVDLSSGVVLELPLDALLKGNTGVSLRIGWDGGYLLTRTNDTNFLTRSKLRIDFVRTGGALEGSYIGYGQGVDETFGYDAASKRADVHASLEGTLVHTRAAVPPALPVKPGMKPPPPRPALPTQRLMWIFADVIVDTDGGVGADGMRARAGIGFDVSAFATALFATRH